ncbi:hypothetical protein WJX81_008140 [Elliptochloris bilobata]|uniref:proline--tRNA ligase n=1 Tax=Elliptochloris bilobata TaxID=381761 RepID=A0AAW1RQY5_9CHLO
MVARDLVHSWEPQELGNAVARCLAASAAARLYPRAPFDDASRQLAAEIDAWVDFATGKWPLDAKGELGAGRDEVLAGLGALERTLAARTYVAGGHAPSLADLVLVCELQPAFEQVLDALARASLPHTTRWFTTLAGHPQAAPVLGAMKLAGRTQGANPQQGLSRVAAAGAANAAAGAKAAGAGGAGAGEKKAKNEKEKKEKKPKEKPEKKAKPEANGDAGKGLKKETKLGLSVGKAEDFAAWYPEAIVAGELISYYDVSGCYILRPASFGIWEKITAFFDGEIKKMGVQNACFPLFVTEERLNTEKDHVEGFAAEVAWVTKSGTSELERPIAIRPTSETVMYPYYAQWIRSHRDLPLRLNQWTNVVRWEFKKPTPFIRTREFLWQEGHCAYATKAEADKEVSQILDLYERVYTDLLAVPVCKGRKSAAEKFAGSLYSLSVEAFVPATGRGVQGGTSHCLGQNFSRMFGIEFEAVDHTKQHAWQNSWGLSTRTIGVMVMVHGDDKGLVLPPRVATTQMVVVPIPNAKLSAEQQAAIAGKAAEIHAALAAAGVRAHLDDRDNYTPGWKYNHWELKGVPLRLELGVKDLEKGSALLARRDTGAKEVVPWADLPARVPALLEQIQADMFAKASAEFGECRETTLDWEGFMAALDRRHMVLAPWCDEEAVEEDVRKRSASDDAMGAKTLCIPLEQPELPPGTLCFATGRPAKNWALWGRSY